MTAAPAWPRTLVAGLLGGLATNAAMLATFRALGFGWHGGGILLDPTLQSGKLIAVWTELEPLPRVAVAPAPIVIGLVLLAVAHAAIYRSLRRAWPAGRWARTWRLGGLIWLLSYVFWEFFTPFNQYGEPLPLIALELSFWTAIALAEAAAIVAVSEGRMRARPAG